MSRTRLSHLAQLSNVVLIGHYGHPIDMKRTIQRNIEARSDFEFNMDLENRIRNLSVNCEQLRWMLVP
jgi:hypothetical protein